MLFILSASGVTESFSILEIHYPQLSFNRTQIIHLLTVKET